VIGARKVIAELAQRDHAVVELVGAMLGSTRLACIWRAMSRMSAMTVR
jgi:hypothetical protein